MPCCCILFNVLGFKNLVLDLNTTRSSPELNVVGFVAAIPGGAIVVNNSVSWFGKTQILKISPQGKVTQNIYSCHHVAGSRCSAVRGLQVLGNHLYIIHYNGTIIQGNLTDGRLMTVYTIPDLHSLIHTGSLYSEPEKIPDKDTLLLCDFNKGEVFTFQLSTRQKQVRITGLINPRSVSYLFKDNTTFYVVCERGRSRINVYNATWHLVRNMGRQGNGAGELNGPDSAIVTDKNRIIVSEYNIHRLSEFTFDGRFVHHWQIISYPGAMSFSFPHLWLVQATRDCKYYRRYSNKLYRYNLYA